MCLGPLEVVTEVAFQAMPVPALVDSVHGSAEIVLVLGSFDRERDGRLEQVGLVLEDALEELLLLVEQILDVLVAFLILGFQLPR